MQLAPPINASNARELQLKSAIARKRNAELARQAKQLAPEQPAIATVSPLEDKFARALENTLDSYLATDDATERAKIARALREVRETYHLWSGQPKPGTIKPESRRTRQSPVRPPEPEPIDPSTPQ